MVCVSESGGTMSIFPATQTGTVESTPESVIRDRGLNFLFDFNKNEFVTRDGELIELTGDASVAFWIEKTIRTEYERAAVYQNTGYGFGLEKFIGLYLPPEIAKLQFSDAIKAALYQHQRIKTILNLQLEHKDDYVDVSFEVELNPVTQTDEEVFGTEEESFTRLSTIEDISKFLSVRLITADKLVYKTSLGGTVYLSV